MKFKKILFYLTILILVILIYKTCKTSKINYVVIGDSISEGRNPYNEIEYGYSNYIVDYLENKRILKKCLNFSNNSYNVQNLLDDIDNNKYISLNKEKINLKSSLRESDLVTVTIGMLDISQMIINYSYDMDYENFYLEANNFLRRLVDVTSYIRKYAKKNVIVIGYYNPFPYLKNKDKIDEMIININKKYETICEENGLIYIDIFSEFDKHREYFPNRKSMNVTMFGQKEIFNKIKIKLDNFY